MRKIPFQDAAVLFFKFPDTPLWSITPFNEARFRSFAAKSIAILDSAEREANLQVSRLPEDIAQTMQGSMQGILIQFQKFSQDVNRKVSFIQSLMVTALSSSNKSKKRNLMISCKALVSRVCFRPLFLLSITEICNGGIL